MCWVRVAGLGVNAKQRNSFAISLGLFCHSRRSLLPYTQASFEGFGINAKQKYSKLWIVFVTVWRETDCVCVCM